MITIVSGLPRSGTSMMMQMLVAGGVPALQDGIRKADDDNLKGYYELEKVKQLKKDSSWLPDADGHVFKLISLLLYHLPVTQQTYQIIFMSRDLDEILASQRKMLERTNKDGIMVDDAALRRNFEGHLLKVKTWLGERRDIEVLYCSYRSAMTDPNVEAVRIADFLGGDFDVNAMVAAVDSTLYRNRTGATA